MKPIETKTKESQTKRLFDALMTGIRIDRVFAFNRMGIADLRSRISEVENTYDLRIDRNTKKGKKYREYFVKNPKSVRV